MRTIVCSVYDGAVKAFMQPFFTRTRGEAVRSFTDAVNDAKHQFNLHASDYTLYSMAEFDDSNGQFIMATTPEVLCTALSVKVSP